jgi:predicted dehydrogenase
MNTSKIKWGIIGCGNIAAKFAQDLALIKNAELTAVASRSIEKAKTFAQNNNSKKAYGSYDTLLKDTEVDIIYIATPHISHATLSIKSMRAGKHVLCEKPLAIHKNDALEIMKTSKETNCFFMEALWTRFNPVFVEVLKRIKNNEIGDVKYINADFSFKSNHELESRVFNLELGGGSLLDIGIYPAFLTYSILGLPKNILASSLFNDTTKCDIQTSMIFEYSQAQAILYSGFTSNSEMTSKISGTEGEIHIHSRWHHADSFSIVKNEIEEKIIIKRTGIGYTYEILECHKCLKSNKIESELWSHQNSLDLITILDTIRKKVGLKYPQDS